MASLATGLILGLPVGRRGVGGCRVGGLGEECEGQLFSHSWQVLGQAN